MQASRQTSFLPYTEDERLTEQTQSLKVSLIISPLDKEKAGGLKSHSQGSPVRRALAWNSGGFGNPEFWTQCGCWSLASLCLGFLVCDGWTLVPDAPFPPWHFQLAGLSLEVRMVKGCNRRVSNRDAKQYRGR